MIIDTDLYPLILSKRFIRILKKINDVVSNMLLDLSVNYELVKETFIDRTTKDDTISLITSDKVNKMIQDDNYENKCWTHPQRFETKIGRFAFRLLSDKVQQHDIEDFVNEYKSIINAKKLANNFKLIEGEELRKWYYRENYADGGGNLSKSCMKHKFCQVYFDIYIRNPEKIKMLILLDETGERILGRSLIWFLDRPSGKVFMDRIYYADDFILNMFVNYAVRNKWLYKLEMGGARNNVLQVVSNNKIINQTMVVKIEQGNYSNYPFVDNICFYDPRGGYLTNDPKYLDSIGCKTYFDLDDHMGDHDTYDKKGDKWVMRDEIKIPIGW